MKMNLRGLADGDEFVNLVLDAKNIIGRNFEVA